MPFVVSWAVVEQLVERRKKYEAQDGVFHFT
jgi:hypothetical protein